MLVVKKTTAIMYKPFIEKGAKVELQIICGITLNSSVAREGIVKGNNMLYNLFFTAANMMAIEEQEVEGEVVMSKALNSKNFHAGFESPMLDRLDSKVANGEKDDSDEYERPQNGLQDTLLERVGSRAEALLKGSPLVEDEKYPQEEVKGSMLANSSTIAKESTLEQSLGLQPRKKAQKKQAIMVYLADSKAFLHIYKVGDLDFYSH